MFEGSTGVLAAYATTTPLRMPQPPGTLPRVSIHKISAAWFNVTWHRRAVTYPVQLTYNALCAVLIDCYGSLDVNGVIVKSTISIERHSADEKY